MKITEDTLAEIDALTNAHVHYVPEKTVIGGVLKAHRPVVHVLGSDERGSVGDEIVRNRNGRLHIVSSHD